MNVLLIIVLTLGATTGLLLWLSWHGGYYPPIRRIPPVSYETKAARIKQAGEEAEHEIQAIFFEGYAEMIEEARQVRVDRLLKERGLK